MNDSLEGKPSGELVIYDADDGSVRVDVRVERETVWLSQRQMADVFDTSVDNVGLHLRNIFADEELLESATTEDFSVVQYEGGRSVKRDVQHYNLEAIISVGYRVNSKRAVRFRQWATHKLRDHLVSGYTLNERNLSASGLEEARNTLDLLTKSLRNQALVDETGETIVGLIEDYADTWRILLQYDENQLHIPHNVKTSTSVLELEQALNAIDSLKKALATKGQSTSLFGNQREGGLVAILGNVEQSMFGKSLYGSSEEKAANLLYFMVKDHPFTDGNKRIGALLFLLYLRQEGISHQLSPRTMTALTLLIAESESASKDLMVRLVMNLLTPSAT